MDDVLELDFSRLPREISEAKIDGRVMAVDNLDCTMDSLKKSVLKYFSYPTHSELMIYVLCVKGEAVLKVNLKEEKISSGQVLIILAGCIFEIKWVSEDFVGAVLICDPDAVHIAEDAIATMAMRRYFMANHSMRISPQNIDFFLNIYNLIKQALLEDDNPFRNQIVQKYYQIIIYSAYHVFLKSPEVVLGPDRKQEIFDQFIHMVEIHYKSQRRIKFYADQLLLSPKYLSSVIKDISGIYASDWIDEYVILEAKALLKSGGLTIQQISDELNFPNQSFFGRYFKHHTGHSPKDYRKL